MSMTQKQGIVTILGSDSERAASKTATSLRRTLSADMSSRKWLSMKKIASSEDAGPFDIWSSIVSEKGTESSYIHPLVKRSRRCLSDNSLQLCTESLGSETGSDGFSSSDQHPHQDVPLAKYYSAKKSPPPSFPPPLPSLTSRRVMPRRENGRLVLEAVSVSAQTNFRAERQDGRLVLTLLTEAKTNPELVEYNEEEDRKSTGGEMEIIGPNMMSSGVIKLHRPASLLTKNPPWPHKFNESLPPPENACDYWWRTTAAQAMEKNKYIISKNIYYKQPEAVGHYTNFNFNFKGCKDHRRSLFREPYCITTT